MTEITPEGSFFVQTISEGPKAEALNAKLRQEFQASPPLPGAYTPKRGDICAAKYTVDDEWYRVKVEKVQGGKASVLYMDYGNRETLPTTRLASLPAAYAGEKPYATEYILPYVTLPKDEEYASMALKYLREDTAVSKLLLNVEYRVQGGPSAASLHVDSTPEGDIVKNLVTEGLFLVENRKERRQNKLVCGATNCKKQWFNCSFVFSLRHTKKRKKWQSAIIQTFGSMGISLKMTLRSLV